MDRALGGIDLQEVQAYRQGSGALPALCGAYQEATVQRNALAQDLAALERSDSPEAGLQEEMLLLLRRDVEGDTVAVSDLYRRLRQQRTLSAVDLFEALQGLYTGGNLEILVRVRGVE